MAKVKLNPILEGIRGQVGDLVFKHYGDEVVISRKADLSGSRADGSAVSASGAVPAGGAVREDGDG